MKNRSRNTNSTSKGSGKRTIPDVAFDGDGNTGVAVYDSYNFPSAGWEYLGRAGTSLATPCWAGLIAIADQIRTRFGLSTLDGPSQTLPLLYDLETSPFASVYFHDITSGNNGFSAGPGYDFVTGLGSPRADALVPALATLVR